MERSNNLLYKISVLALLLSIASICYGQRLMVGPTAGVNISTITDVPGNKAMAGFTGGVNATYSHWEHLSFTGQALYTQSGTNYTVFDEGFFRERNITLHYLEVPVLANYLFGTRGDFFRPKVSAGSSFGWLMDAEDSGPFSNPNDYRRMNLGITAGTGFNYQLMEAVWFTFDVRYTYGLNNLNRYSSPYFLHNSGVSAVAGVSIGIFDLEK